MDRKYTDINSDFFDNWVENGWEWGQPISHEVYEKAKKIGRASCRERV